MSFTRIKLSDFFRKKATEDSKETEPTTEGDGTSGESTEPTTEDGGEESESEEAESTEEGGETEEPTEPTEEDVEEVQMTTSEFNGLRADAGNWNKFKGELDTLRTWKASMDGVSGGMAKEDQTNRNGKNTPSILDAPWNKQAIEASEKLK